MDEYTGEESDRNQIRQARDYLLERLAGTREDLALLDVWQAFFDRYDPIIRRFALSCGVHEDDVFDLTQDVWGVVLQDLPAFEYDPKAGRFRAWLFVRVRNVAVDRTRKETHRVHAGEATLDMLPDKRLSPESLLRKQRDEVVLQEAFVRLHGCVDETNYDLFVQRKLHGLSIRELAQRFQLNESVVRTRVSRAAQLLRQILTELGYRELFFPDLDDDAS